MRSKRRRRFRSPVAMRVHLYATAMDQPPSTPPSVKAYVDLLQKDVYDDDRDVQLLHVIRDAADNPMLTGEDKSWVWDPELPRWPIGPDNGVRVSITVHPLRLYTAAYDAIWHRRDEVFGGRWSRATDRDGASFFSSPTDDDAMAGRQIDDLLEEQREDEAGVGLVFGPGGFYDRDERSREVRSDLRRMRDEQIRAYRNHLALAQRPGPGDRPGPPPFSWLDVPEHFEWMRERGISVPGVLHLPLPSEIPNPSRYGDHVRGLLEEHAARFRSFTPFTVPLALDIAVRRPAKAEKDLDNLAHTLMGPYERTLCAAGNGTIASYRVYTASGPPGVRVLVMPDARLHALDQAMDTARRWILRKRPHLDGA